MYSFILVFAAKELNLIEVEKCAVVDAYIIANREEILSEYCKSLMFNVNYSGTTNNLQVLTHQEWEWEVLKHDEMLYHSRHCVAASPYYSP
jgi:hypothetical protein